MAKPLAAKVEIKGVDHLSTVLAGTSARMRTWKRGMSGFAAPLLRGGTMLTGALGVGGLAGAFASINSSLKSGGEINDLSKQLGISAEMLQEVRYAGKLAGVEVEEIDGAFSKFSATLGKLRVGSGPLDAYFKKIKGGDALKKQALGAATTGDAFEQMIAILGSIPKETDRAAAAQAMFGKSGMTMTRLLADGTDGFVKARQEAVRLGLVLDTETIGKMDEAGDSVDRAKMSLEGLRNKITVAALPAIESLANATTEWLGKNQEVIAQDIGGKLKAGFSWVDQNKGGLKAIGSGAASAASGLLSVADSLGQFAGKASGSQLALLTASLVGINAILGALGLTVIAALGPVSAAIASVGAAIWATKEAVDAWSGLTEARMNNAEGSARVGGMLAASGMGAATSGMVSSLLVAQDKGMSMGRLGPAIPSSLAKSVASQTMTVQGETTIRVIADVPVKVDSKADGSSVPQKTIVQRPTGTTSMRSR